MSVCVCCVLGGRRVSISVRTSWSFHYVYDCFMKWRSYQVSSPPTIPHPKCIVFPHMAQAWCFWQWEKKNLRWRAALLLLLKVKPQRRTGNREIETDYQQIHCFFQWSCEPHQLRYNNIYISILQTVSVKIPRWCTANTHWGQRCVNIELY